MRDECGSVEWAGKFSTKFSGLRETVPDTQDYILWDKIGKSIGVYSGVYEYTQQIPGTNTEYTEYTRYLGICCELQAGFLQCNWFLLCSETQLKTTITRKWNPCRAARSLALPLEAGRTLQTVLREGQSTLVLRTKSYNPFSEPVSPNGGKHPLQENMTGECLNPGTWIMR